MVYLFISREYILYMKIWFRWNVGVLRAAIDNNNVRILHIQFRATLHRAWRTAKLQANDSLSKRIYYTLKCYQAKTRRYIKTSYIGVGFMVRYGRPIVIATFHNMKGIFTIEL